MKDINKNQTKYATIIKSNSLVDAVYKMSVNSTHLFSVMLRYITAKNTITDNGQLHTITALEFGKLLGIKNKSNQYSELQKATKELLSTIIKVQLDNGRYREHYIFDTAEYAIGKGYTSLAFARNFLPLIQDLQGDYTRLRLAETLRLKRFASIRIYEKLMQYRQVDDSGWWRVEMNELKILLGVKQGHIYWENKHFNIKIFNPAINEIEKQLEWQIKIKKHKVGRVIKEIEIRFKDIHKGGLFSKEHIAKGNKQTRVDKANRAAEQRAKVSALVHHKKIGIK